ncbi:unnamed protein product [Rhodiola kirilowii]
MKAAATGCLRGIAWFSKTVNGLGFVRDFPPTLGMCQQWRFVHSFRIKESLFLKSRRCPCNIHSMSIPVGVALLTPQLTVLKYGTDTSKCLPGNDFCKEDEVTNEALDKLISSINTDPNAYRDVGLIYAEKLCKARNFTALAKLVQVLRENQITISPCVYNILLLGAGEANDVALLFRTLKDMLASDFVDSTSYVNTAKALGKIIDASPLVKFVQDVDEFAPPIGVTFLNRVIYSLAGCGHVDKALLIYDNMKSLTCKPDLVTYNTVLGILGRTGRVDEMLSEFSSMKESGILPDLVSFNTLINSLKKVGRLDLCLKYLKEMTESGIEPDLRTYTALIETFGRLGNVEESVRLFDELKARGVCPSIYIYRSLIDSLKKAGKAEVAVRYLEEMKLNYEYLVGPMDFKRKRSWLITSRACWRHMLERCKGPRPSVYAERFTKDDKEPYNLMKTNSIASVVTIRIAAAVQFYK